LTYLFNHASDAYALPLHEYYHDDRNWPAWASRRMLRNDGLVKDRKLIRSMLVLQDAWKRFHNFPLGDPNDITCGPDCKANCKDKWDWNDETMSSWPMLWGWPSWPEVKMWEIVELAQKKKAEQENPYQKMSDHRLNHDWLLRRAEQERSVCVPEPSPGVKVRGGKFWLQTL
jgi:hypothetical protein